MLAEKDINIASFHLGRRENSGEAVALIAVDQKVNKKMYRGAIRSILSELVRQERLIVVEKFGVEAPKTKELLNALSTYDLNDVLIVTPEVDENLFLASRNLYKVDVRDVRGIDPVSLIAFEKVLITADAVKQLEEALA